MARINMTVTTSILRMFKTEEERVAFSDKNKHSSSNPAAAPKPFPLRIIWIRPSSIAGSNFTYHQYSRSNSRRNCSFGTNQWSQKQPWGGYLDPPLPSAASNYSQVPRKAGAGPKSGARGRNSPWRFASRNAASVPRPPWIHLIFPHTYLTT